MDQKLTESELRILKELSMGPISWSQLIKRTELSNASLSRTLDKLINSEKVEKTLINKRRVAYQLNNKKEGFALPAVVMREILERATDYQDRLLLLEKLGFFTKGINEKDIIHYLENISDRSRLRKKAIQDAGGKLNYALFSEFLITLVGGGGNFIDKEVKIQITVKDPKKIIIKNIKQEIQKIKGAIRKYGSDANVTKVMEAEMKKRK